VMVSTNHETSTTRERVSGFLSPGLVRSRHYVCQTTEGAMSPDFAHIAHIRAARYASAANIDVALSRLGGLATQPLESLDHDRRVKTASRFVRVLDGLSVHDGAVLEHDLLTAIGAGTPGVHMLAMQNAISLITVRNHLHELLTTVGISWSDGMLAQSAVSDVARHIVDHGGGTIEMQVKQGRVSVRVFAKQDLGAVPSTSGPRTPAWIVGVSNLSNHVGITRGGGGTQIEFMIDMASAAVA
jgi:hypothetical protein